MKQCSKCKETKPLSDFNKNRAMPGGYAWWCRACDKKRAHEYYKANKKIIAEKQKTREQAEPEKYKKRYRKNALRYRKANLEARREADRNWHKRRYEECPNQYLERSHRRRSLTSGGGWTEQDIKRLYTNQQKCCAACGNRVGYKNIHRDHVVPLSAGGSNGIENIQILCPFCNLSKGAKDPIEWAQQQGRLL